MIAPNSPSISTLLSESSGAIGDTVHDSASLTDATSDAGGTVTYTVYTDNECSNQFADAGTVDVTDGDVPDSNGIQFNSAGTFYWQAVYSGDDNNNAATSPCTSEQLVIAPNSPSISTLLSESSGAIGDTVHDSASLTDATSDAGGTVTYTVYTDNECSNQFADAGTVDVTDGDVPDSNGIQFNSPGTFYWQAVYSGDDNNNAATSPCTSEQLVIALNAPKVTTVADPSSAVVGSAASGSVSDTATFTDGFQLDGQSASFTLYSDPSCDPADATSVTGSATIDGGSATFTGDGSTLPVGTYYWGVSYAGDANNTPVSECGGDEGVQNEKLTIGPATPSAATTLKDAATNTTIANGTTLTHGSSVYDTAQIGNTGGQPLTGTLSFRFFHNGDCSGTPASVQTGVAVGGHSAATGALDEGSYGFQAMYVAGDDPNHTDSAWSACEPFKIQGLVDLAVTKSGSPNPVSQGGPITWTMVVTNNGPDADTGVVVSDPLPAGTTFVSVSVPPPATCTGGAIISCSLGTMTVGQSITITLVTTANVGPTITNTVKVVGDKPETNLANNTASASVALATKTPVKPCIAVSKVTPKQLFVGRKTTLKIHLTQDGKAVKGIHVRIKGPKINLRTKASNSKGIVNQTLKMKKAGVLVFTPIASKACNTKRVGVTNVFTPPVTG